MIILGINAYHGDAAAVLVRDGELVAAVEEERLRRIKHWAGFPQLAIETCLRMANVTVDDVDAFALPRQPRAHWWRKAAFVVRHRPTLSFLRARQRHHWGHDDITETLAAALGTTRRSIAERLYRVEHHQAHLDSAFYAAPFEQAAVCAIDGFGDFVSTSMGLGQGTTCRLFRRVCFPHSLGLLYLAITQYLGFPAYGDEYKVMGLAAYGTPDFNKPLQQLVRLKPRGDFALDLSFFCHWSSGDKMHWDNGQPTIGRVYSPKLEALLGPARHPEAPIEARHADIAASLQHVYEQAMFHVLRALHKQTYLPSLCLAGGCALNSVANGKIREQTPFQHIYVQPAAADSGTALGAALHVYYQHNRQHHDHQNQRHERRWHMAHASWGPSFEDDAYRALMSLRSDELQAYTLRKIDDAEALCQWVSRQLARGLVVGWFQGPMEWGPRALGNRSILADPRRADMAELINRKVKTREPFRPFAASILGEALGDYFADAYPDAFMTQVYSVRPEKRDLIPAVTHIDGTCRIQVVGPQTHPRYRQLLKSFAEHTGVPILLNTSFNVQEPIVHKPSEALDCFLRTDIDTLVLGHYALEKTLKLQHEGE